jgi:hypothetical protein
MKKSIAFMAFAMSLVLVGCGHNISVYSKGVGAELAWRPNTIMPSIRFGSYENLDLVQKENNQVRYTSNNGVGFDWFGLKSLFGGEKENNIGMGTVLEVKTGPQINGYVADALLNPDVKPEHVEIAKAVTGVQMNLGDKETHVSLDGAKTNTTPVVTTEKGVFGSVTVTTPTNQYTEKAIREQVKTNSIHDVLKSYGFYIICAVIVLILALAFVIVHILQKSSDPKNIISDIKTMVK